MDLLGPCLGPRHEDAPWSFGTGKKAISVGMSAAKFAAISAAKFAAHNRRIASNPDRLHVGRAWGRASKIIR